MRSVSGVVKAMWQLICGCTIFFVRKLKGVGSASPGCSSNASQRMVRPSRRGGVPVLRRQVRKPERAQRFAEQNGGRFAAAARGIALFAAVDEAVEECAGGDDGGAGEEMAAVAKLEAEDAPAGADRTRNLVRIVGSGPGSRWRLRASSITRSTTSPGGCAGRAGSRALRAS